MNALEVEEYLCNMKEDFDRCIEQPWSNFRQAPKLAGIYAIKKDNKIIYIGETSNIYDRLIHHNNRNGSKLKEKIEDFSDESAEEYLKNCFYKCIPVNLGRIEFEKFLITLYKPLFNNYNLRKKYK